MNFKGRWGVAFFPELSSLTVFLKKVRLEPGKFFLSILLGAAVIALKIVEVRILMMFVNSLFKESPSISIPGNLTWLPFIPESGHSASFWMAVLVLVLVASGSVFQYLASLSVLSQARSATVYIRRQVFERFMDFGKNFYDTHGSSYLHAVLTKFTDFAADQLQAYHHIFRGIAILGVRVEGYFLPPGKTHPL